ncbi:hypothetical protein [Roseicitreum antarcticum]|uniref:hypothetical protein n=1 Tax=Roseicitreum antarcticum TaxID=564137 RepID=UPI000B887389|nr:hypothetical protein [Roseicitreum antarcticum]
MTLGLTPKAGVSLVFDRRPNRIFSTDGKIGIPANETTVTDAAGEFSIQVAPGAYQLIVRDRNAEYPPVPIIVPAIDTVDLSALIGAMAPPELSVAQQAALDAIQASVSAATSAADALSSEQGAATSAGSAEADRLLAQAARVGAVDAQTGSEAARDDAVDARDQIEGNSVWYLADDADSVTLGVGDQVIVAEASGPYPSVTLAFLT